MKFSMFIFQTHNCTVIICCVVTVFFSIDIDIVISSLRDTVSVAEFAYLLLFLRLCSFFKEKTCSLHSIKSFPKKILLRFAFLKYYSLNRSIVRYISGYYFFDERWLEWRLTKRPDSLCFPEADTDCGWRKVASLPRRSIISWFGSRAARRHPWRPSANVRHPSPFSFVCCFPSPISS